MWVTLGIPCTQRLFWRPHLQLPVFLRIEAHWLYGGDDNNHTKGDRHKEHDYMLCSIFQSQFLLFVFWGAFSHWNTRVRRFPISNIVRATAATCSPLLKRNISRYMRLFFLFKALFCYISWGCCRPPQRTTLILTERCQLNNTIRNSTANSLQQSFLNLRACKYIYRHMYTKGKMPRTEAEEMSSEMT